MPLAICAAGYLPLTKLLYKSSTAIRNFVPIGTVMRVRSVTLLSILKIINNLIRCQGLASGSNGDHYLVWIGIGCSRIAVCKQDTVFNLSEMNLSS
jgi:hypothetical protein